MTTNTKNEEVLNLTAITASDRQEGGAPFKLMDDKDVAVVEAPLTVMVPQTLDDAVACNVLQKMATTVAEGGLHLIAISCARQRRPTKKSSVRTTLSFPTKK